MKDEKPEQLTLFAEEKAVYQPDRRKTTMKIYTKANLIEKLKEIRNQGWIGNTRPGNAGGIGNTLEDFNLELTYMNSTVQELLSLQNDLSNRKPTVRETVAAAAFLAQFYNGIENTLKRISQFQSVPLPTGENWHSDLFGRFCVPSHESLPGLFDESLATELEPYLRFRHLAIHTYGFQLDWNRMREGVEKVRRDFFTISVKPSRLSTDVIELILSPYRSTPIFPISRTVCPPCVTERT
jgi:hypothetical protein